MELRSRNSRPRIHALQFRFWGYHFQKTVVYVCFWHPCVSLALRLAVQIQTAFPS